MEGIADTEVGLEETSVLDDTSLDTDTGTDEGTEGQQSEDGVTDTDPAQNDTADAPPVKDGKLSAAAKTHLEALKATDPKLAKALTTALFANDRFARAVPGGLKEVQALRSALEPLGGVEGLQEVQQKLGYFSTIDEQYTAGDPRFIEALTDTPEGQEAFTKLAPIMIQKFREFHPEGFNAMVCSTIVADMMQDRIPLMLERLQDFIGENPKAQEVLNSISAWVNKVDGFAKKQVAAPQRTPDNNKQSEALTQREMEQQGREWRFEAKSRQDAVFQSEWDRLTAGRKLSAVQIADIKEQFGFKGKAALDAVPNFNANAQKYFKAKDQAGYLRHIQSTYQQVLPRVLKQVFDKVVPSKPGPRVAAPGTKAAPAAAAPGVRGPSMVAAMPSKDQVDFDRTSPDMIRQGRAMLKTGNIVQWRK